MLATFLLRRCQSLAGKRSLRPFQDRRGTNRVLSPHAIRDDIAANLEAMTALEKEIGSVELTLLESGGDNLTAIFSQGLVDLQIFVIDACGGDDIPRKGGPGITKADLLIVNKTDLAHLVGSDLDLMASDAKERRGDKPTLFVSMNEVRGAAEIATWVQNAILWWTDTSEPSKIGVG